MEVNGEFNELKRKLDRATTHTGFNFSAALMEGTDNGLHAGAGEIS